MIITKSKCIKFLKIIRVVMILYLVILLGYSIFANTMMPTSVPEPTEPVAISTPTAVPSSVPTSLINSFTDVQEHWSKNYFSLMLDKRVVSGYPDNTLRPEIGISRAEAAVMVVKAADIRLSYSQLLDMEDDELVQEWARKFIITAVNNEVIKGYSDKTFRPENKITRCEMIVMVLKAFGFGPSEDKTLAFADSDTIPDWSRGFVKKAVDLEIVKGYEKDNTFRPNKEIIRAEAVTIIAKCMDKKDK